MKCAFLHSITKKLRGFLSYKVIYAKHASFLRKKPEEIKKIAYKKF